MRAASGPETRHLAREQMLLIAAVAQFRQPLHVLWDRNAQRHALATDEAPAASSDLTPVGVLPPLYPEWLGGPDFIAAHNLRFAYICGEMARGIATPQMVIAAAQTGLLGFFGAAGLEPAAVRAAIRQIAAALTPAEPFGANLIHSPDAPGLEDALVDLYIEEGVRRASASAFMQLSPAIVRYMARGLTRDACGRAVRRNHVFAKLSRPEVATQFMSPPPQAMLRDLVFAGALTTEEAEIASELPVAADIIVEADSGGHTDNRPLGVLLPLMQALRERLAERHPATRSVRVGAAGGIGAPQAVAAAFAAGAAFVVTGSVNQAAVESGLSPPAKALLAAAGVADVAMAPSADMFEMGVRVQVLRKGTLFAQRAERLHEIYRAYESIDALPPQLASQIERDVFRCSIETAWRDTRAFFAQRDPSLLERAEISSKVKLALLCRWYLGQSSRWAIVGERGRELDYQIWCGPAQGAFNAWVEGSFLEPLENRSIAQIALNLMEGAATVTRAQQLRAMGVATPPSAFLFEPRPLA